MSILKAGGYTFETAVGEGMMEDVLDASGLLEDDDETTSADRAKALASRKRDSGDTVGDHGSDATSSTGA